MENINHHISYNIKYSKFNYKVLFGLQPFLFNYSLLLYFNIRENIICIYHEDMYFVHPKCIKLIEILKIIKKIL